MSHKVKTVASQVCQCCLLLKLLKPCSDIFCIKAKQPFPSPFLAKPADMHYMLGQYCKTENL